MKKMNFKWLAVLCMAMGFVNHSIAQIYESEICFYVNTENSNDMYQVKFSGETMVLRGDNRSTVRSNLLKSQSYYEDYDWSKCQKKTYCYDKSTSSREVYRAHRMVPFMYGGYTEGSGWKYFAFSTEKDSFITWEELSNNYDGTIHNKKYYVRISKEELLPQTVDYDFLNE